MPSRILKIHNPLRLLTSVRIYFQHDIPKKLITDNVLEFTSHHFKKFSQSWNIKRQTFSPHYHQSNGLVEQSIQTVKRTLKEAKYD